MSDVRDKVVTRTAGIGRPAAVSLLCSSSRHLTLQLGKEMMKMNKKKRRRERGEEEGKRRRIIIKVLANAMM